MKTNYHNKIVVLTDLHDTLIHSKKAWIKAFRNICGKDSIIYKTVKKDYDNLWKRKLCKEHGVDYEVVKNEYLKYITRKEPTIKLIKTIEYPIYLVSNAKLSRVNEDIEIIKDITFEKIYSRDDGIKPDEEYMKRILDENEIDFAIMIGNDKTKDVFKNPLIKTLLVGNKPYFILKRQFAKIKETIND